MNRARRLSLQPGNFCNYFAYFEIVRIPSDLHTGLTDLHELGTDIRVYSRNLSAGPAGSWLYFIKKYIS
jgi:hypothetical protein